MAEIIDFSDLAKETKFKVNEDVYILPSLSNKKAKALFELTKKISDKKEKMLDDNGEEQEVDIDESFDYLDFQAEFISSSIVKEDKSPVTKDEVMDWPTKVSNAVNKLVMESINGINENTEQEKKS